MRHVCRPKPDSIALSQSTGGIAWATATIRPAGCSPGRRRPPRCRLRHPPGHHHLAPGPPHLITPPRRGEPCKAWSDPTDTRSTSAIRPTLHGRRRVQRTVPVVRERIKCRPPARAPEARSARACLWRRGAGTRDAVQPSPGDPGPKYDHSLVGRPAGPRRCSSHRWSVPSVSECALIATRESKQWLSLGASLFWASIAAHLPKPQNGTRYLHPAPARPVDQFTQR